MWLLSTDRAELHFFPSPEEVPAGYAAVSHVWNTKPSDGPPEQSFQDVRKLARISAKGPRTNPRDLVCAKLGACCRLAESHGYRWVWIDTCCIDKTSSAELSEAINSMFRYYALADICYGYLRDVADAAALPESVWFRRGWTLQELIAPRFFLFVSRDWRVLGSKADFAGLLQRGTGIPAAVLRLEVSHTEFSIAHRMSWFGGRQTTRPEDQAYCLLGLFDIHMPPLYGEGTNAFRRLQEEIMKQSADTTLFAWEHWGLDDQTRSCLLAPSPLAFMQRNIVYTPPPRCTEVQARPNHNDLSRWWSTGVDKEPDDNDAMTFSITPEGILAHIPIIVCAGETFGDLYWSVVDSEPWLSVDDSESWSYVGAESEPWWPVAGCKSWWPMGDSDPWWSVLAGPRHRLLLRLEPDPASNQAPRSSSHPSFRVCSSRIEHIEPPTTAGQYTINGRAASASWQTVLIKHRLSPHRLPGQFLDASLNTTFIPAMPMQLSVGAAFRFGEARIRRFLHECQADRVEVRNAQAARESPGGGGLPTTYIFMHADPALFSILSFAVIIRVGQCRCPGGDCRSGTRSAGSAPIWATVDSVSRPVHGAEEEFGRLSSNPGHDCLEDHVSQWTGLQKRFYIGLQVASVDGPREHRAVVSLSFTPCPINPGGTLLLDASFQISVPE